MQESHLPRRAFERYNLFRSAWQNESSSFMSPCLMNRTIELADARYAALGVLDPSGETRLSQFVTVGIDQERQAQIGDLPHGLGRRARNIRDGTPWGDSSGGRGGWCLGR